MTDRNKAKITAAKVAAEAARDEAQQHVISAGIRPALGLGFDPVSANYAWHKMRQKEATFRAELEEEWAAYLEGKR